jgi:hypothetical protein
MNATVIMLCRNKERGEAAYFEVSRPTLVMALNEILTILSTAGI